MKGSILAIAGLLSAALAHPETLSRREIERRSAISKRCEPSAANFNRKRMAKRWAGTGNTTYEIQAEAPYFNTIQNDTCVLSPVVTEGPYVWPRSQTLRQDMSEGQPGVPLWMDVGVIDVRTCEPLPNILLNFWHCNATGSYSSFTGLSPNTGFVELLEQLGIGEENFEIGVTDLHTDGTTFLRGMWPTNSEGVMEMKTTFPGFYVGRTLHIHVQAYSDWTLHDNGTVSSGNIVSTGQLYFDETLSTQIMALEPYSTHTQISRTLNTEDSIFGKGSANGYDPVFSVVPADGSDFTNGVIGYITIGVDPTADGVDNTNM
ncbi:putative protocatechuate -dioxygenase beta subunit [Rosellinia necatrix]|uniref:Putative protocatechuate-dioxygenase beta subunit n=1 Tax=Rosellinia necatrix TaxID=77044 RepID=A0A1W2TMF5_ROSNE|nr:putative protocatechuate -dioxygenase beta subunit [Rosellinia necatrix]